MKITFSAFQAQNFVLESLLCVLVCITVKYNYKGHILIRSDGKRRQRTVQAFIFGSFWSIHVQTWSQISICGRPGDEEHLIYSEADLDQLHEPEKKPADLCGGVPLKSST